MSPAPRSRPALSPSVRGVLVAALVLLPAARPAFAQARGVGVSTAPAGRLARPATPLDTALLGQAYARAAELPRFRSLLVWHNGTLVRERYYRGARAAGRANIKSASKSVLSALVGIAIARGQLGGVGDRLADHLPQYLGPDADPRTRAITIEDLLTMRAGLETTSFYNYGKWVTSPNWVRYAISQPMVAEPGGPMIYSTGSTHLLSAVLTRATTLSTWEFARRSLAAPLGISLARWPRDPQGIYFGGNDMYLTPREMVRFGVLYLQRGRYQGRQVVPAAWVDSSFVSRTTSGWSGHAYGYGWWIRNAGPHRVYFAWGYGGQFVFVVPSLQLVVVTTSDPDARSREGDHVDAIHTIVDRYILPAVDLEE